MIKIYFSAANIQFLVCYQIRAKFKLISRKEQDILGIHPTKTFSSRRHILSHNIVEYPTPYPGIIIDMYRYDVTSHLIQTYLHNGEPWYRISYFSYLSSFCCILHPHRFVVVFENICLHIESTATNSTRL